VERECLGVSYALNVTSDGEVPFTRPQKGVDPVVDADLATKGYGDANWGGGGGGGLTESEVNALIAAGITGKQDIDATLTALAGLATGANKMAYSTGTDAFSQTDLTSFARSILDDADAATVRSTLGLAALAVLATVGTSQIDADAVTDAKLRNSAALSVIGRSANSTGDPADIAAGTDGHVLRRSGTALGFGTVATAGIADAAVTLAKMANLAAATIIGRASGAGTGVPTALSASQVAAIVQAVLSITGDQVSITDSGWSGLLAGAHISSAQQLADGIDQLASSAPPPGVVTFVVGLGMTWAVPATETIFGAGYMSVHKINLTNANQFRLHVMHNAAAAADTRIRMKYASTFTNVAASYSTIGTSEVQVTLGTSSGAQLPNSGWIDVASGAKGDVFVGLTGLGGDGVTNPNFISIYAEIR
jgi:hypothetical protein